MSVLIGHASINENRTTKGGIAGDQTGKEVCVRSWYSSSWNVLLRCKDRNKAELMAKACESACANPYIGYDQNERNTLFTQAKLNNYDLSKIKVPCECDCSSLMAVCAECAGIRVYKSSNAPTTATMKDVFSSTGMFNVLTDAKYFSSANYLQRGDILIKQGHTVMILGNGTASSSVSSVYTYTVGKTYTTMANLYIRTEPFGNKMKFECITQDAKKNSRFDAYGCAILNKGTRVTCKAVKQLTNSTWMLIPSGWICAIEEGKVYIE